MKAAVVALVIAICLYFFGHHNGWEKRNAEMQAEIAVKNEESRSREQKLTEQINQTSTELKDANDAITQKQSALDRAISSGRVRFRTPSCVQANASAATPSGNSNEARADADTETLRLIAQIAADGDRAIVQLNACIDAYNQVREQVNGQR
jgi:flagellar capping protein FliD